MSEPAKIRRQPVPDTAGQADRQTLPLGANRSLTVIREPAQDLIEIKAADDSVMVTIRLTEAGPVLVAEGLKLDIKAAEHINLEADRVSIRANTAADIASGGELSLKSQNDTTITADDDVRVNGQLIHLN